MAVDKDAKRAKSETLSLRMDPKTRFMLELLSRVRGQSITVVVERAIRDAANNMSVSEEESEFGSERIRKTWSDFWDPNEGVRTLKLLLDRDYPSNFEEDELRAFTKTHWPFFYTSEKALSVRSGLVVILWPKIGEYQAMWREKTNSNYWAAGEAMNKDLTTARVQGPEWPPKATEPMKKEAFSRDLDDEIPF
jgi:hypothetical protein